ncbi:MAG: ATP-binding protein [Candidatus Omnitrophica bacterium]|nr:ATP-binding protein [Candidatus Omnitrophota bacterium]MBU0878482.1 ATP-binding protein [Candidatus Omnitrophota bacterium]MBU0896354.1 ATP-binding protein [Candidatus Omnitrophota bacterium]MBU1134433.1 ATP-binding protein [Candidatus Omnitrophota bacterium]MBU1367494.1 ATP-binding protein [Candidatus Omnitrophota bacterium]
MKQIVIISGKGGTGKTVLTASFAALAKNAVFADCDVDAADLHLLLKPTVKERHEFRSGKTAFIDKDKCVKCGKCIEICRFSAISGISPPASPAKRGEQSGGDAIGEGFIVDEVSCEGCAFCSFVCPQGAIKMEENLSGEWFISDTRFGPMVHAKLGIAQENSGKLVSLVRKQAKELAEKKKTDWVIVDGAPGIGCPVIASLSGIDCAVVVTEPTLSGLHDADRVIKVASHFMVPVKLVINKCDLNEKMTEKIEQYCYDNEIQLIGKLKFDKSVVAAMIEGKTIIEYAQSKIKDSISDIWDNLKQL